MTQLQSCVGFLLNLLISPLANHAVFMIRFSSVTFAPLTSIVKSSSCAHSPLALVHARSHRALHPHTDISHFLRLQWPHHHHVYVTKLISSNILQTNPGRPRLRTWNTHQQLCWTGHMSVIVPHLWGLVSALFPIMLKRLFLLTDLCSVSSRSLWMVCPGELIHPHQSSHPARKTCRVHWCSDSQSHSRLR